MKFSTFTAALLVVCAIPLKSQAQVAISMGVQEVYDSNVFLENDKGALPGSPTDVPALDGDPDDDLITNLTLGLATALPQYRYVTGAVDAQVGSLIFSDQTDESRLTLDTNLVLEATELAIPKPFYANVGSAIHSGSNSISSAEGTASRQSQVHDATLGLGLEGVEIAKATTFALRYALVRHDFLGEFTFSNGGGDRDPYEEKGSDYIQNGLRATIDREFSDRLTAGIYSSLNDFSYTSVDSRDPLLESSSSDPDTLFAEWGVQGQYVVNEKLALGASTGLELSHLKNLPADSATDEDQTTFVYGGNATYLVGPGTSLELRGDQRQGTDIDGRRIRYRTFILNAVHQFSDTLAGTAGARFLNSKSDGGSFAEEFDRYETTVAVNYTLTEALVLALGYNYTNQDQTKGDNGRFVGGDDYEAHRVFLSLNAGMVGIY